MVEVSSMDTFAEIIAMWNSQGYSENEIYRMLTAWDLSINKEILNHLHQKQKNIQPRKQKHAKTIF